MVENISEGRELRIDLSGMEYPVTCSWELSADIGSLGLKAGTVSRSLSGTGSVRMNDPGNRILLSAEKGVKPEQFALGQNYPNPFNPTTIITYQLPAASRVTLKVYDLLGRQVDHLVDQTQDAGFRSVEWDPA